MLDMEQRISHLDAIMAELAHAQVRGEIETKQLRREIQEMTKRMEASNREFNERMGALFRRSEDDTAHMKEDTAHMKEDTAHMKEDTARMKEDTARLREETRRMNKAWGDLANKMGTVAEDIVAPNIPRIAIEEFGFTEVEDMLVRPRRTSRRGEKRSAEYDVICAGPDKVAVAEVKSTPSADSINATPARLAEFFDFFPEYEGRQLIGVFASWSIDPALRPVISAAGLYGIAMGEDTMDVVARPAKK